jgi:hemoglobin
VAIEANAASDQAQRRAIADEDVARDTRSAYERIGGGPAVKELVDRFYDRVLADKHLARYFTTDMHRLKWHQAALLTKLLGGPDRYQGRELGAAHAALRIRRRHYVRVAHHLTGTMEAMRLPNDVVTSVAETAEAVKDQIVGVPPWRRRMRRLIGRSHPGTPG